MAPVGMVGLILLCSLVLLLQLLQPICSIFLNILCVGVANLVLAFDSHNLSFKLGQL